MRYQVILTFVYVIFNFTESSDYEKLRIKRDVPTNITLPSIYTTDNFHYYAVKTYNDPLNSTVQYYNNFFNNIFSSDKVVKSDPLSNNYDYMMQIDISFPFSFYGISLSKISIAVAGFIYMNDISYPNSKYLQYIAPLLGDFSTLDDPDSTILYCDTGNAFFVKWSNLYLNNQQDNGTFTFQVGLFQNGTIVFVYNEITTPASEKSIFNKVGIADSYVLNTAKSPNRGQRRNRRPLRSEPTSFLYDEIYLNRNNVVSGTVVVMTPNPTCQQQTTCGDCLNALLVPNFNCSWCAQAVLCSSGFDRNRQVWQDNSCPSNNVTIPNSCSYTFSNLNEDNGEQILAIMIVCFVLLFVIIVIVSWFVYAYRHPNSTSGIWLIEHRPRELLRKLCGKKSENSSTNSIESNAFHSLA